MKTRLESHDAGRDKERVINNDDNGWHFLCDFCAPGTLSAHYTEYTMCTISGAENNRYDIGTLINRHFTDETG